ncbi:hypothetical protein [Spirosoma fluviale]|uniref:Uncharacterized protein n=1 Tax=Spirosoma fluviale TaxID=1597977 RepID=A0A286GCE0_9BACT|nr:hypothetical protein [Spirosoma fluviale]SOD93158.1 hypothetical protein SAMN06269250_4385 [Spirosoma fluviale]
MKYTSMKFAFIKPVFSVILPLSTPKTSDIQEFKELVKWAVFQQKLPFKLAKSSIRTEDYKANRFQ